MQLRDYGTWECPTCGDECSDPEAVYSTCCHNGHAVYLSTISNGRRTAFLQEDELPLRSA